MKQTHRQFPVQFLTCIAGMFVSALGTVLMLHANLGVNPWSILHQGISLKTGVTFGVASQLVGLAILLFCCAFRHYPGFATMLYIFFFGYFVDLIQALNWVRGTDTLWLSWVMLIGGNTLLAAGSCLYLHQCIGAGPKDALMLLITQKTGIDVGVIRVAMELSAVVVGYLLGGPFGIGTIVCALTFGPTLRHFFKWTGYNAKTVHQENFLETLQRLRR